MAFIGFLLMAVVCVEAIVEIVVKSKVFGPIRAAARASANKSKVASFLNSLLSCGYCFSVWAATLVCLVCLTFFTGPLGFLPPVVRAVFIIIVVHRLSNYLHNIVDRVDKFYLKKQ